jgi:hypothetical protein
MSPHPERQDTTAPAKSRRNPKQPSQEHFDKIRGFEPVLIPNIPNGFLMNRNTRNPLDFVERPISLSLTPEIAEFVTHHISPFNS